MIAYRFRPHGHVVFDGAKVVVMPHTWFVVLVLFDGCVWYAGGLN